jgi:hypothetical protein
VAAGLVAMNCTRGLVEAFASLILLATLTGEAVVHPTAQAAV